jgi:hypothetical protein
VYSFWWKRKKERDHWEEQGVDGIGMDLREIGWGRAEWIVLTGGV